jgi:hypothetical protein
MWQNIFRSFIGALFAVIMFSSFGGIGRGTWFFPMPDDRPDARTDARMCHFGDLEILFGGLNQFQNPLNDTWVWNGISWEEQNLEGDRPRERNGFAFANDEARGVCLMFGGISGQDPIDGTLNLLGDTWKWDGHNWTQLFPESSPSPRAHHDMVYDSISERIKLFGGTTADGYSNEMWEWDGETWTPIVVPTPPGRAGHALAYDYSRNVLVLYGGYAYGVWDNASRTQKRFTDTWEFKRGVWSKKSTKNSPNVSHGFCMDYATKAQKTILFGGINVDGKQQNSAWVWDGRRWRELDIGEKDRPAPRDSPASSYNKARDRIVVFAGAYLSPTNFTSEFAFQ